MYKKTLDYQMVIKSEEHNILIDDLDIDFDIRKTCRIEPDIAYINIWNLDETIYNFLLQNDSILNLIVKTKGGNDVSFFRGKIDSHTVLRDVPIGAKKTPDICTSIKLLDSSEEYLNSYINEDYRDSVSSVRIIFDCLEAMGLKLNSPDIIFAQKMYSSYKAKGPAHVVLKDICEDLNLHLFIQNGVVRSAAGFDFGNLSAIKTFSRANASSPMIQGQSKISFYAEFCPDSRPSDIIRCSFDEVSGLYFISDMKFVGNNYNRTCITKITIGI